MIMNNSQLYDLSGEFNTLDMLDQCWKKQEFTDVQLKISGKLFHAHRNILSLYSPVLKAMISDQWSKEGICEIGDEYVDVEIVEDLLSFLYTGKIDLTPENAHPVCVAAHFLQIPKLLNISVKQLCYFITTENVLSLFEFSFNCELKVLQESCFRQIQASPEVFHDPQVLKFSFRNFKALITGMSERSMLREKLYHCIVRWVEENVLERSEHLPNLLENIPLEELSFDFLTQTVSKQKLVFQTISCAQALLKAFGELRSPSQRSPPKGKQSLIVIGGERPENLHCLHPGIRVSSEMNWYNGETKIWQKLPDMHYPRYSFGATVINDRDIVVCGGYSNEYILTDTVEIFIWAKQVWETLPCMPIPLKNCSIVEHNGNLYAAGGITSQHHSEKNAFLCYSFETKNWNYLKAMSSQAEFRLVKFKNHLYVIGGQSAVEKYDFEQNSWITVVDMRHSSPQACATLHNKRIYSYRNGGFDVYDPESNAWMKDVNVPDLGDGTSFVSMNGELFGIGGQTHSRHKWSDSICRLDKTLVWGWEKCNWAPIGQMSSKLAYHCSVVGDFH